MNNTVDEFLDPLMLSIHGDKHSSSPVIRLATLMYCMSLPKKLMNDIINNKNGSSTVMMDLGSRITSFSPIIQEPNNILEKLLCSTDGGLVQRINLPFQYVKQNHIKGAGFLKSEVKNLLGCEMQVMSEKDSNLKFELFHTYSKRFISFIISD